MAADPSRSTVNAPTYKTIRLALGEREYGFEPEAHRALDALLAELQQKELDIRALNMNVKAARDLCEIREAELQRTREALEPFVTAANVTDVWPAEDRFEFEISVTGLDIRRARAALTAGEAEPGRISRR